MQNVLIHLHPDFADELEKLFLQWNNAQSHLLFKGFRPPKEQEAQLLAPGAIELEKTLNIASQIREELNYSKDSYLFIFTEKKMSSKPYHQLYFGGSNNVGTISLDFTRKLFANSSKNDHYIFRAIISNILNALSQNAGFECHNNTVGCILDFCNNMPDIIKGFENGHKFCNSHKKEIKDTNNNYLIDLVNALQNTKELAVQDIEVTRKVLSFDAPVEIGIIIALEEEFREVFAHIKHKAKPIYYENICQYYYIFEMGQDVPYRCVITFIGGMGTEKAAIVGDRLIEQFKPCTIVNVGIAGSTDKDVIVGDIVIAEQADKYLHAAKAIPDSDTASYKFQLSGDPYKSTPSYVSHAKNLEFAYQTDVEKWNNSCCNKLINFIGSEKFEDLLKKRILKNQPKILTGNIASDSIVGAADLFINWLKNNRDRKYLAIEMESAGVLNVAYTRSIATLIIRGISDYADIRKKDLDEIGDGVLRKYAMNNAITLLWLLMDLQLLKHKSLDHNIS